MGTYHRSMVGALTASGLKVHVEPPISLSMNTIQRYGATIITSAAILTGAAGQAQASPTIRPVPGAAHVSTPCGTPSKAARLIKCRRSLAGVKPAPKRKAAERTHVARYAGGIRFRENAAGHIVGYHLSPYAKG